MNLNLLRLSSLFLIFTSLSLQIDAQGSWNPITRCFQDVNGQCVPNTLLSAVPFLRIVPDAVGGAMGDAGVATNANASSLHYNASKIAFADSDSEFAASYTPWLRNLGLNDVYMAYLSGYKKIDDLQSFGFDFKYFSLGDITFTDVNGGIIGQGRPRELEVGVAYARKLSPKFSASVGASYIYSNLASGQMVGGVVISAGTAFAADLGVTYNSNPDLAGPGVNWSWGAAITNLGSKVSYTNSATKDFIPTNLGLGVAMKRNIDEYNSFTLTMDINKLMIPTPDTTATAEFRDKGTFAGIFGSFSDAPGGLKEEIQELAFSFGAEYWYDNQFAVRAGYYYEHPLKGDRQYLTVGIGLKYNVFGFDLAYLAPTSAQRSPLDNTLRFTFTWGLTPPDGR
ncbi:MAG: hypothetical protein ACI9FN_001353 [Saprospiraceae bacterium]|jgi:hypothetical protein